MDGKVYMWQLTQHRWQIRNKNDVVLQTDITAHSQYEATEYIKRWISSFSNWEYELVPLQESSKVHKK